VVDDGRHLRLYYAGYQRGADVRFRVFGGLALSEDGGETFRRLRDEPVMGPSPEGRYFRVPHTVSPGPRGWQVWYGAGSHWRQGKRKTLPVYDVRYQESADGIDFAPAGHVAISLSDDEHRVGRPYVRRGGSGYEMYYAAGTEAKGFRLGFATSPDGRQWTRRDDEMGISPSASGWDSEMLAYPAVVTTAGKTYLFYNGNDYGREGFGYAELEEADSSG
jgi:hypothetical protein